MKLVDANLLLYATISDFPQHPRAREWMEENLNAPTRFGMPWPSLLAFLRIASNPRIFPAPMSMAEAWSRVAEWVALPNVWTPVPSERHAEILAGLIETAVSRANLIPDAHLAALAIEHGLILCSTDRDFSRFHGLHWEHPLA